MTLQVRSNKKKKKWNMFTLRWLTTAKKLRMDSVLAKIISIIY